MLITDDTQKQASTTRQDPSRRRWLTRTAVLAATASHCTSYVWAHNDAGQVNPPTSAPGTKVTWHNGTQGSLRDALIGKVTALQTMFTGCSATCPIQGALFGAVQAMLPSQRPKLQLLSLSIDPLSDDPRALTRWLTKFNARSHWRAGAPDHRALDALLDFLRARNNTSDRHTAQVYFFNPRGELALRTTDFPPPEQIAKLLMDLEARFNQS